MTAEFDRHARSYSDEVSASVSFSGQDVEFFARCKADHLVDLSRRHLGDLERMRVLDVGCGVGVTDAALGGVFGELHGVDVSGEAVARAGLDNPAVNYAVFDGHRLPYPDGAFDMAFTICVLHHVETPDRLAFTREMTRVVRPGGIVAVFEHNPFNPLTRVAVSRCEFDEGVELLSRAEAKRLLVDAGMEPIESRYILFLPFAGGWARRVDQRLWRLPIGAQHYEAARRPR